MKSIKNILRLIIIIGTGFLIGSQIDSNSKKQILIHSNLIFEILLLFGLYGSVFEIDKSEFKENRYIVLKAITIGVLLKILIAGSILYVLKGGFFSFFLAVMVCQIDPLAVSQLLNNENHGLSPKAKNILGAWASFDDPVTVLISVYLSAFFFGDQNLSHELRAFTINLISSIFLGILIYLLSKQVRTDTIKLFLIICFGLIALYFNLIFLFAIVGLFIRPKIGKYLPQIIKTAFFTSLLFVGFFLTNGFDLINGFYLSVGAVLAQIGVGFLITKGLNNNDRIKISLSQQNGITAIILALLFESQKQGIIAIIVPAIIFINIFYELNNFVYETYNNSKAN